MIRIIADFKLENKTELYARLDAAAEAAHAVAMRDGKHGVIVTRHDFDHFSVALSPTVPFGLILENDQAQRDRPH